MTETTPLLPTYQFAKDLERGLMAGAVQHDAIAAPSQSTVKLLSYRILAQTIYILYVVLWILLLFADRLPLGHLDQRWHAVAFLMAQQFEKDCLAPLDRVISEMVFRALIRYSADPSIKHDTTTDVATQTTTKVTTEATTGVTTVVTTKVITKVVTEVTTKIATEATTDGSEDIKKASKGSQALKRALRKATSVGTLMRGPVAAFGAVLQLIPVFESWKSVVVLLLALVWLRWIGGHIKLTTIRAQESKDDRDKAFENMSTSMTPTQRAAIDASHEAYQRSSVAKDIIDLISKVVISLGLLALVSYDSQDLMPFFKSAFALYKLNDISGKWFEASAKSGTAVKAIKSYEKSTGDHGCTTGKTWKQLVGTLHLGSLSCLEDSRRCGKVVMQLFVKSPPASSGPLSKPAEGTREFRSKCTAERQAHSNDRGRLAKVLLNAFG
ncbi:hypothetical protein Micbo1qcDRAFT_225561 [Microdochium bolleyi]|uniref:Uncharacterized protein n=1 Tax=Microdochium bolleyi TaxID=196109 RepID=A0A136IJ16_9PEZI|nr:hypothetical protein Micbo1qcDRAFT_225561 [Microdochium bolleyi]